LEFWKPCTIGYFKAPSLRQRLQYVSTCIKWFLGTIAQTIQASVVRLDVSFLHFTVLNDQRISLGAVSTEDGGGVEVQIKSLGELDAGISKKANLTLNQARSYSRTECTYTAGTRGVEDLAPSLHAGDSQP
jgi:hypothetical protein